MKFEKIISMKFETIDFMKFKTIAHFSIFGTPNLSQPSSFPCQVLKIATKLCQNMNIYAKGGGPLPHHIHHLVFFQSPDCCKNQRRSWGEKRANGKGSDGDFDIEWGGLKYERIFLLQCGFV